MMLKKNRYVTAQLILINQKIMNYKIDTNLAFSSMLWMSGLYENLDDAVKIFKLGGSNASKSKILTWKKVDANARGYQHMPIEELKAFIAGYHSLRIMKDKYK